MNIIHGTTEDISKQAAEAILTRAGKLLKNKESVVLALPGGKSVLNMYREFSRSDDPVWKNIHIFLVDERAVPIYSDESNFKLIKESFANTLIIKGILPEKNLHPFIMDSHRKDYGASEYIKELKKYGGKFDIVLISSGEDGHVADFFPDHKVFSKSGSNFFFLDDSPKLPSIRITSGAELISGAGSVILFFIGESKSDAYKKFKDKNIPIKYCPAKIVEQVKDSLVYTDIIID
jgi:6-phosphogluconolactonase